MVGVASGAVVTGPGAGLMDAPGCRNLLDAITVLSNLQTDRQTAIVHAQALHLDVLVGGPAARDLLVAAVTSVEARQVFDLPPIRLYVAEYRL